MTEIQVTISSRALERFIFTAIIIVLLVFVIKGYVDDRGEVKGQESNAASASESTATGSSNAVNAAATETCYDGIKNQDETGIDCGGVCGGYWYEGKCWDYPQECKFNSDCADNEECLEYRCVEKAPECTKDADCGTGRECVSGQCRDKQLSNKITVTIDDVDTTTPTTQYTAKVTEVKFTIDNGKAASITLSADIYIYESTSDPWYAIKQDTIYFPSIASGETWSQYIKIDGKTFGDSNKQKTLRAVFDNEQVGTITSRFTAS